MVFAAVTAAVTLLPPLLSLLGDRIDNGRVVRRRIAKAAEETAWWRFGHRVSARPWPYLVSSVAAMLALAAPALARQTAFPAAGDAPEETTHRQAYDLLAEGFGVGSNAPLLVVAGLDSDGVGRAGVSALTEDIASVPGFASVSESTTSIDGDTVVFSAIPTTGPADPDTSTTIERVRDVVPGNVYVSGITATYGVLVAVFQWGWGASTGDNTESVARGLSGTGRVVTSAALIMIAVFLSFVASPVPSLKMLGLGLATAVLVDATVVRMVLVPATMALLGKANWWLPPWLDKVLPHIAVESAFGTSDAHGSAEEWISPGRAQVTPELDELVGR